jgi:hypothetical protein
MEVSCVRHVTLNRNKRKLYKLLVEKQEGKRPLGRSRGGWEDNMKTSLTEMGS